MARAYYKRIFTYDELKEEIAKEEDSTGIAHAILFRSCKIYSIPAELKTEIDILNDLSNLHDSMFKSCDFFNKDKPINV